MAGISRSSPAFRNPADVFAAINEASRAIIDPVSSFTLPTRLVTPTAMPTSICPNLNRPMAMMISLTVSRLSAR